MLKITSNEALDARVADVVRRRIELTRRTAAKDKRVAEIENQFIAETQPALDLLADMESDIRDYCVAHRAVLFPDKKSRETTLAVIGFEITPPRVETSGKRIPWAEVVKRLLRLPWGKAYLRQADPKPDKDALLADREKLTDEQCVAAGIRFTQDEQFFLRPKPITAQE